MLFTEIGSIDHYCGAADLEANFVKLNHRQIWSDILSCHEIMRDSKSLFQSGEDAPTVRILLTVSKYYLIKISL
jgi:hypothetical protein